MNQKRHQISHRMSMVANNQHRISSLTPMRSNGYVSVDHCHYHALKHLAPTLFVTVLLVSEIAVIVSYAQDTQCVNPVPNYGNWVGTAVILMIFFICWKTYKFRDNFNISREIKAVSILYLFTVVFAFSVMPVLESDIREALAFFLRLIFSSMWYLNFIFVVWVPLRDQRRMERRVYSDDFSHVEKFEHLLEDSSAMVAFEEFMRKEFCEELLFFSRT